MAKKLLITANALIVFAFVGVLSAFAQVPDITPPVITGVVTSAITQTGATVGWTTDEAADGQMEYGTSTAYGLSTTLVTATTTAHSIPLTGLTASTTYHYLVKSKDAAGNLATSTDYSFTTLAPAATTTTPPATTTVAVRVKVEPRTLNTKNKGKWIEAEVVFPKGYDASAIDVSSIRMNGILAPVKVKVKKIKWYESFHDRKTAKVEMKFSRADVATLLSEPTATSTASTATTTASILPPFSLVKKDVTISGTVGADTFSGITTVRVLIKNAVSTASTATTTDFTVMTVPFGKEEQRKEIEKREKEIRKIEKEMKKQEEKKKEKKNRD